MNQIAIYQLKYFIFWEIYTDSFSSKPPRKFSYGVKLGIPACVRHPSLFLFFSFSPPIFFSLSEIFVSVYEGYFSALQRPLLNPDFGNPFLLAQMMGGREGLPPPKKLWWSTCVLYCHFARKLFCGTINMIICLSMLFNGNKGSFHFLVCQKSNKYKTWKTSKISLS